MYDRLTITASIDPEMDKTYVIVLNPVNRKTKTYWMPEFDWARLQELIERGAEETR